MDKEVHKDLLFLPPVTPPTIAPAAPKASPGAVQGTAEEMLI